MHRTVFVVVCDRVCLLTEEMLEMTVTAAMALSVKQLRLVDD